MSKNGSRRKQSRVSRRWGLPWAAHAAWCGWKNTAAARSSAISVEGFSLPGILKLAPELLRIHTMLRRLPLADEDHRNIRTVALLEDGIIIYVDFSEGGAELS